MVWNQRDDDGWRDSAKVWMKAHFMGNQKNWFETLQNIDIIVKTFYWSQFLKFNAKHGTKILQNWKLYKINKPNASKKINNC